MDRPALFSGPMVQSLLARRKKRTRRLIRQQPDPSVGGVAHNLMKTKWQWWSPITEAWVKRHVGDDAVWASEAFCCPHGLPGDRLWVREAWRAWMGMGEVLVEYRAGGQQRVPNWSAGGGGMHVTGNDLAEFDHAEWCEARKRSLDCWRPSIHMPRAASRLTLTIEQVWVERLQDITEEEARLEGLPPNWHDDLTDWKPAEHGYLTPAGWALAERDEDCNDDGRAGAGPAYVFTAREAFELWWTHINGAGSWAANPWVWAVAFEVAK